jgi:hypothetical protein
MPNKKTEEPFIMLYREVINSFAWRAASLGCRRFIDRLCEEHMAQGGVENGNLVTTYEDLLKYGIHSRTKIAQAQREAIALGLVVQAKRGQGGNCEHREAHRWELAFIKTGRRRRSYVGTAWKRFSSLQEAEAAADKARAIKDTWAVAAGKRRAAKRPRKIQLSSINGDTGTSINGDTENHRKAG